mmetsp:Transcript_1453/g.3432  ORF Transcript_1453/g.3432 Transcript_1453/m.3432 type:complete len:130 (-) Transcript_1453:37-426(-)
MRHSNRRLHVQVPRLTNHHLQQAQLEHGVIPLSVEMLLCRIAVRFKTHNVVNAARSAFTKPKPTLDMPICCGTGCANCVWITYADRVNDYLNSFPPDQREKVLSGVLSGIEDESYRQFVEMEMMSRIRK